MAERTSSENGAASCVAPSPRVAGGDAGRYRENENARGRGNEMTAISDKYDQLDGATGFLGKPTGPETTAADGEGAFRNYKNVSMAPPTLRRTGR